MPGDYTLGLEYPTCRIDGKPCPSYFSTCDTCVEKEKRKITKMQNQKNIEDDN